MEAANKAGSMAANSLHASTDREQVLDFLSQAEGEGRWLVEGLAGLAGYGRINP
jgi:hypothetical protein